MRRVALVVLFMCAAVTRGTGKQSQDERQSGVAEMDTLEVDRRSFFEDDEYNNYGPPPPPSPLPTLPTLDDDENGLTIGVGTTETTTAISTPNITLEGANHTTTTTTPSPTVVSEPRERVSSATRIRAIVAAATLFAVVGIISIIQCARRRRLTVKTCRLSWGENLRRNHTIRLTEFRSNTQPTT